MGDITLWQGDCLDLMKEIPDNSVDMIFCDLPYGTTACKWDKAIQLDVLWNQYKRIIKSNGAVLLFGKQPFTTDLINSNRKWYRYSWVWLKNIANGYLNAKVMPLQVMEDITVFYRHKPIYNPQIEKGFERKTSKASSKRKCKAAFTDPSDVVIDPVAGSGTTLRAAMELGRNSYGFELSKEFYNKAKTEMLKPQKFEQLVCF